MGNPIRKEQKAIMKIEIIAVELCLVGLLLSECFISNLLISRIVGGISAAIGLLCVIISERRSKT